MEFLVEVILELVLEVGVEASKSTKIPRWIRFFLIGLITIFYLGVIGFLIFLGIMIMKDAVLPGLLIAALGVAFLIGGIYKFRKVYIEKKGQY